MATTGLSLVGFMDQHQALHHLRRTCVPGAGATDADLLTLWQTAQGQLGAPFPNAGRPAITDIPATHASYLQQLVAQPWVSGALQLYPQYDFKLVEVDALYAFQFVTDKDRSAHHCKALSQPPTLDQMLNACLPMAQPNAQFLLTPLHLNSQSMLLKTRDHNLRVVDAGVFDVNFGGVQAKVGGIRFQDSLPFVHVVRFNGACYLHNGFHRSLGCRLAGATHIPCLIRDVGSFEEAGVKSDGSTFGPALFGTANPPTVGHFTHGRALNVQLRQYSRMMHVSWAQYSMPDEYE